MTQTSIATVLLACVVPATALGALCCRIAADLWNGSGMRRLRSAPLPVRVAALLALTFLIAFGGSKGGGEGQGERGGELEGGEEVGGGSPRREDSESEHVQKDKWTLADVLEELAEGRKPWRDPALSGTALAETLATAKKTAASGAPAPNAVPPLLPDWYKYDPTDTDGDGIPDLWEIWTRSDPLTPDSWLDRDGDGLSDLYEFWYQTDPRTADTDGDGFDDYFEIDNGMNPLVKADFSPEEPDTNENGIIDLWEGSGYLYGFQDSNNDGFDDTYAAQHLVPASAGNYDVLAEVRTTRSAALVWDGPGGTGGIVLPATLTGTVARLRLPFGEDTTLRLIAAPPGADPPPGQLWKARLRVEPAPARWGQTVHGGRVIVSEDGAVVQREVERESVLTLFGTAVLGAQLMGAGGTGDEAVTHLFERGYEVTPESAYFHRTGEQVGPFLATNLAHVAASEIVWSADYGTMFPTNGILSTLTVTGIPPNGEPIKVKASSKLLDTFDYVKEAKVWPCPRTSFGIESYTTNFAPFPGSNAVFTVSVPGCLHFRDPGWIEAEIVRITLTGTQHVAWVNMEALAGTTNRYVATTNLASLASFSWDGIVQEALPPGEYKEVFTTGQHPFNLAAPPAKVGDAVPPPYVTLVVRLLSPDKSAMVQAASRRILVPQIVQVMWMLEAEALFRTPKVYAPDDTHSTLVYSADFTGDRDALIVETLQRLRGYFPASVNIRFVPFYSGTRETTKFLLITPELHKFLDRKKREVYEFGLAPPNGSLQRNAGGEAYCHFGSIYARMFTHYKNFAEGEEPQMPFPVPVSSAQLLETICRVSAHEVGHTLGLVDTYYLDGVGRWHNPGTDDQTKIMNMSTSLQWMLKEHPPVGWRKLNRNYLEFVLPVLSD